MFGRKKGGATATLAETAGPITDAVTEMTSAAVGYADALVRDEKLRQRLAATILARAAARQRARQQTGITGFARGLASDPVLRAQVLEIAMQVKAAQNRARKARSHKLRNTALFISGLGMVITAVPSARQKFISALRGRRDDFAPGSSAGKQTPTTIAEEIEVAVPVSTAYNQWTQFEEFPQFMNGVDEVRQLDDTLLHWAATVAGKHAEWDAKIIEQEPDRRIAWESVDGKHIRGTVNFEEAGPSRSRVRLQMAYTPESVGEKVGSKVGLDKRRIRGDLQRFRELIEAQGSASGAWRREIKGGTETSAETS